MTTHNTFNSCENPELKAWNRASVFFNLMGDEGRAAATAYCSKIPKEERAAVMDIFQRIKNFGYEVTKQTVIRNNNARG